MAVFAVFSIDSSCINICDALTVFLDHNLVINAVKVRHHFIELISEYGLSLVSIFVAYIWIQYRYVIKHKRKGAI